MKSIKLLKAHSSSERHRRGTDEADAEAKAKQNRDRAEGRDDAEAERGRGATQTEEVPRRKPAEFRAMNVEMREPELAGETRSFIGSAQQQLSTLGNCRHAHAAKGAHLAPLTPLTGAAHARGCIRRTCEQRGLRGALQARI